MKQAIFFRVGRVSGGGIPSQPSDDSVMKTTSEKTKELAKDFLGDVRHGQRKGHTYEIRSSGELPSFFEENV